MNAAENPQIAILFDASARDERTLRFNLDHEIFGFHAQQAVEKLLKVPITARGEEFEYTHDLKTLVNQVADLGETIPPSPLTPDEFTEYAVSARYDVGKPLPI